MLRNRKGIAVTAAVVAMTVATVVSFGGVRAMGGCLGVSSLGAMVCGGIVYFITYSLTMLVLDNI